MWRLIAKEICGSGDRGRFAMLEVIMNQRPQALAGLAQKVRSWKGGAGKRGDLMYGHYAVGGRVFMLVVALSKNLPLDARDWLDSSRKIALGLAVETGATDCVVFCKVRRSLSPTYDGISFFRFGPNPGKATQ
jgi:hypothetical protein